MATKALIDALALTPIERREIVDDPSSPGTQMITLQDKPINIRQLPVNKAGEIDGYYDPSTLKDEFTAPKFIQLHYDEGFPTVDGCPFWERLENEPYPLYEAFKTYRDMGKHTSRTLAQAARLLKTDVQDLATLATLYYWQYRANAFDKFRAVKEDIEARKAVADMETRHGSMATKLIEKVQEALEDMEPGELTPQMMIEWTKSAVALERVSRKMDPTKPQVSPGNPPSSGGSPGVSIGSNTGIVQIVHTDDWRSS